MAQNPFYVDPGNDFSSGLAGLSNTMANIRQAKIQEAEVKRRQEREERAQKRFEEVQGAAMQAFESQDPDVIARTSIKYPEITEMLKQTTGLQDELKNREALGFTRAFATASPESRPALYEQRIQSILDRGGDPTHTIQSYQDYMQNPEAETRDVISYWAGIDPKGYSVYSDEQKAAQKVALEQQKMEREDMRFERAEAGRNARAYARAASTAGGSAADKRTAHQKDFEQYQELKKSDPVGAKEYGMAAGFVGKEGRELSPQVQKRLSTSIDSAVAAENSIGKLNNLADDIEKSELSGGLLGGTWAERAKEITGSQDAVTELRKEFAQVRASQASANLPPGAASDADVALALGPIPSDNANKKLITSYLRGQAKLQKINADFHNFKADYMSQNGSERGMLQAWKEQAKQGAAKPAAANPGQPQAAPSVTTQAQFDALPSGAVYLEDGVQYRKP